MSNNEKPTPEEKYNQALWLLLQEIKYEQLLKPVGEKIDFLFEKHKTLSEDIQEKLFHKLNSEGRLELERIESSVGIPVVSGRRVFHDALNRFTGEESYTPPSPLMKLVGFRLTIHQEKFDEFYHSLEQALIDKPVQPPQVEVEAGKGAKEKDTFHTYKWEFNKEKHTVTYNDSEPVRLQPVRFFLWHYLYTHSGKKITLPTLYRKCWKYTRRERYPNYKRTVQDALNKLRHDLLPTGLSKEVLESIIKDNKKGKTIQSVTFLKNPDMS